MKALTLCRIGAVVVATVLAGRTVAFGQEQRGSIEGSRQGYVGRRPAGRDGPSHGVRPSSARPR